MTKKNSPFTGWYVINGGSAIAFIPYSSSFNIDGVSYMATTQAEADRLATIIVSNENRAEANFFKSHPELNP